MRLRFLVAALVLASCLVPSVAGADATLFLGRNSANDDRSAVRGFAVGVSLLVVGFEFEYANAGGDETLNRPSLRTTSGNVFVQTVGLPGFQLYLTTGAGIYREWTATDQETALALNNGGGAKINLAGPLRARIDYRIFNLRGSPRHDTVHRIYAGLNLAF
jgi:hypothetical protein